MSIIFLRGAVEGTWINAAHITSIVGNKAYVGNDNDAYVLADNWDSTSSVFVLAGEDVNVNQISNAISMGFERVSRTIMIK